jgi:general secretion pathway protein D
MGNQITDDQFSSFLTSSTKLFATLRSRERCINRTLEVRDVEAGVGSSTRSAEPVCVRLHTGNSDPLLIALSLSIGMECALNQSARIIWPSTELRDSENKSMPFTSCNARQITSFAVVILMTLPSLTHANDGKKYFKNGIQYAESRQWDKAAERLALAVAEDPSNVEYQLHLQRALVHAAIMLVERGDRLAAQKDYDSAYNTYRQAYAFDATNEVALIKMRRMLKAQGMPVDSLPVAGDPTTVTNRPRDDNTRQSASSRVSNGATSAFGSASAQQPLLPSRRPARTDAIFHKSNLLSTIEQVAQSIHLNVAFEQQVEVAMRNRPLNIELRDVTAAEALEIILQSNNLMYTQISRRTIFIMIDSPQTRMRFEPMAVRTFYVKNADINDLKSAVASTVGTKQIVISKQLNALVIRDSPANLELIDSMISSLDKSKAEVLIDVRMYEVSRNDLLQIGNQFSSSGDSSSGASLSSLGGIGKQESVVGKAARTLKGPFALAVGLPSSTLSFFQDRGKARLLASTQVHVLDNEQHQIRIGQRVPVKTGSSAVLALGTGSTSASGSNNSNGLGTIDNIQYENVGLNIDIQPQVFDDEVQVKMKIESSSVDRSTGELTPSFNQRTMSSVARIRDGQVTMIAGVSRSEDSKQIKGIPFVGLIPILGRFFATPSTSNQQSDVVITVTPHILRSADISDEDHLTKDSGRGSDPFRQVTIQQIIDRADHNEVRQGHLAVDAMATNNLLDPAPNKTATTIQPSPQITDATPPAGTVKTSAGTLSPAAPPSYAGVTPQIQRTQLDEPGALIEDDDKEAPREPEPIVVAARGRSSVATRGQDFYVAVTVNREVDVSSASISLDFDPNILEVKALRQVGSMRVQMGGERLTARHGRLTVQLEPAPGPAAGPARGELLRIVFRAKRQGHSPLKLNEQTSLRSPSGQLVRIKLQSATIEAR